jgi:transcriptional regulator with XRE-family HTH domain
LRETRYDRGLSLTELAARVEMSPAALAGALWGETALSPADLTQLVHALELEHELAMQPGHAHQRSSVAAPPTSETGWPTVVAKEGSD